MASPAPVMCIPPPFPGAAPASLLVRVVLFKVVNPEPAEISIPPPARLALLPSKVESFTVKVPPLKIPPPLPEAPFATLFCMVLLVTVKTLSVFNIPPPSVARPFWIVTASILTVKTPALIAKTLPAAPPSIITAVGSSSVASIVTSFPIVMFSV